MKKFSLIIPAFLLLSTAVKATLWEGEYELNNGIKIMRTATGVKIQSSGMSLQMNGYKFGKGSTLGNSCASESGCLSPSLGEKEFQEEVSKLGKIVRFNIKKN